ncbi:hypothetical protein [Comamonas flocculans]|uniref:Uncharacterized protein n=1 Tax=Comamonas flocculans TaxID=2597701 RepID=A0A5B8RWY0_9BURK|nr:hypothetical protein [Comamonas flocculans]QEA13172.1 hypothetical protein FOZ74_09085 [Comamonas flocculans]
MPPAIQPGASMHGIALRHDFQQSPVGQLGGRQIQQGQAQPARSAGRVLSDIGRGIQSLASRALNAVTPHGVRSGSKFRAGLKESGAQLGELLGALSHGRGHMADGATALRLLQALPTTARPATSRGLAYADLIEQRTAVHLANMSPAQREALHAGLAMAENSALKGDPTLAAVRRAMEQGAVEAAVAALREPLDLAISMVAEEAADKGITGRAFQELYNTAREVLEQQGFRNVPRDELRHMQRALVLQALEQRTSQAQDAGELEPLASMVNKLPTRELHALMNETRQLAGHDATTASFVVMGAIGLRAEQLEQTLTTGFAALLSHAGLAPEDDPGGPLHSPQAYMRQVAEMGQALAELREHSEVHDLRFPEAVNAAHARVLAHLEDYLTPDHLLQLSELNSSQLHAFGQGLRALGVQAGQAQVAADANRRREEVLSAYAQGAQAALTALATGNLAACLQGLARAQPLGDEALQVHMNLGMKAEGADEIMDFRARLMERAMQEMDTPALQALSQRLNSQVMEELASELSNSASLLLSGGQSTEAFDPRLGATMFDRVTDIHLLREAVGNALQARELVAGEPGWAGQAPQVRELLLAQYGVALTPDDRLVVRFGRGGPAVQDALKANIDAMVARPQTDPPHDVHGQVTAGFIKDLPRARYAIATDGGQARELLDAGVADANARMAGAVAQLRALAGNNDALLMLATRLANQNVQAGMQAVMLTQSSPLRLDDGTPGRVMGVEHNDYRFESDGEGGLLLTVKHETSNISMFFPAPRNASEGLGAPVLMQPEQSRVQYRFALHIGADLSVRMHEPLEYSYELVPAPPQDENP